MVPMGCARHCHHRPDIWGHDLGRSAIIIGAGVIGLSSAYTLASRGWRVTLVDRATGPAMETSHANGAQLSYCYTDALGSPAILASLPQLLLGKGGVSFRLSARPDYVRWLVSFALNCSAWKFRQNTLDVLDLAAQSRRAMDRLCDRHSLQFDHRVAGKIHLLYSDQDRRQAEALQQLKSTAGCTQHIVERADLASLDSALTGLDSDVIGAISTPSEVVGDPYLFCLELTDILVRDYAFENRFDCEVNAIREAGGEAQVSLANGDVLTADLALVAGANDSNQLLAPLGHRVPVQPMKGYSFEMPLAGGSPDMSVTDGKRRLVFTRLGDRIRVAGIAELGNRSRTIDPERIEWLINAARECLPDAGDYEQASHFWSGLRPATPHSQPIIRRASPTIAINTGHGALGWTLAMGSAERLADLLDD